MVCCAPPTRACPTSALCVLFLGSNIGNFDPPGAARVSRDHSRAPSAAGDSLLIGADLVKPERELLLAYDDPLGVTAAFNRNLLVRINRELGANFDVNAFSHRAVWNRDASRIEMHLVSEQTQRVDIPVRRPLPRLRPRRNDLDGELLQVRHRHLRRDALYRIVCHDEAVGGSARAGSC